MTDNRRAPLVPSEVNLQDFQFMPLDVLRLRDSDLSAVATGEEFKAAVLLWCAAWHQVPAASVPNDERWLARHSGAGPAWRKVRAEALRGFVECSDGRLYHEVVAEKALESWAHKLAQRERTRLATEARKQRNGERDVAASARDDKRNDKRDVPRNDNRNVHQGTGTGQGPEGTGTGPDRDLPGDDSPEPPQNQPHSPGVAKRPRLPRRSNGVDTPPKTVETWNRYADAYQHRYGTQPVRNATVNGQLAQVVRQLGLDEAPAVAEFYVGHNRTVYVGAKHAVNLLLRDCTGLRTEWATGHKVTDTEARNADRTAHTGDVFGRLIAEVSEGTK